VTKQSNKESIHEMRSRYRATSKKEQTRLPDEIMNICGWNWKYLIRVMNKKPIPRYPTAVYGGTQKQLGRPQEYHAPEILAFLVSCPACE
jgi:hypothetical protein